MSASLSLATSDVASNGSARVQARLAWAKTRPAEAEQLLHDAVRLLSCSHERVDSLKSQGFFRRCWGAFSGEHASIQRATIHDVVEMQGLALRFVQNLQEQSALLAQSVLAIKSNQIRLAEEGRQTREMLAELISKSKTKFRDLETSTELLSWHAALRSRKYDTVYPSKYFRLLALVNDIYSIKPGGWSEHELGMVSTALETVGVPPDPVTVGGFVDGLVIETDLVGYPQLCALVTRLWPGEACSDFAIDNVSSDVVAALHLVHRDFCGCMSDLEALGGAISVDVQEALARVLISRAHRLGVDLRLEMSLHDLAIELLAGLRLANALASRVPETCLAAPEDLLPLPSPETVPSPRALGVSVAGKRNPRWNTEKLPKTLNSPSALEWIGETWVAATCDGLFESGDLVTWKKILKFKGSCWNSRFDCVAGRWFALSDEGVFVCTQPSQWRRLNMKVPEGAECTRVMHDGRDWVFFLWMKENYKKTKKGVIFDSTEDRWHNVGILVRSEDLENFSQTTMDNGTGFGRDNILDIGFGAGAFVALGLNIESYRKIHIYSSQNGENWKKAVVDFPDMVSVVLSQNPSHCAVTMVSSDQGICIAHGSEYRYASTDGVAWEPLSSREDREHLEDLLRRAPTKDRKFYPDVELAISREEDRLDLLDASGASASISPFLSRIDCFAYGNGIIAAVGEEKLAWAEL